MPTLNALRGGGQAALPKQYLPLQGQPIALFSLDVFAAMHEVGELVVVCDPSYDGLFRDHHARLPTGRPPLLFARPGDERQDSVSNGFEVRRATPHPVTVRTPACRRAQLPFVSLAWQAWQAQYVLMACSLHGKSERNRKMPHLAPQTAVPHPV